MTRLNAQEIEVEWIKHLIAAYRPLLSLVEDLLRWSFSSHWVRR